MKRGEKGKDKKKFKKFGNPQYSRLFLALDLFERKNARIITASYLHEKENFLEVLT